MILTRSASSCLRASVTFRGRKVKIRLFTLILPTHLKTNVPLTRSSTFSVDSTGRSSKNLEMLIRMLKAKMVSTADLR